MSTIPNLLVYCRPTQISQVLLNLLNNAFDALEDQQNKLITIEVAEDNNFLKIYVTDSGPGVPESIRRKIMEPFFPQKKLAKE